jgi:hypothetical protein
MFFFCIFVVPDYRAVSFFHIRPINIVAVLLHDLLKNLEPVLVKYFEKSLPLSVYAVLIATLCCQPQIWHAREALLNVVARLAGQYCNCVSAVLRYNCQILDRLVSWLHLTPTKLLAG